MTELEALRQRRELVSLAAELQRATLLHRLDRIESSPAQGVFRLAGKAARRPALLTAGTGLIRFAARMWRKRSARARH